ncbi:formate C-acetyltransferase [Streptomyces sp. ST2-7A]|uniref:formate C-acetyltransferase n=1 Tax=Streptomyces sp. ST2-7A TaxID=2907214 RepID=UPI001F022D6F|nr:formate C-acetyltransferase [Streptomyces sp. ST2-7A]MCE7082297.1 formate C-acetyltransferase [Streptomyces sp. ST2-7A]
MSARPGATTPRPAGPGPDRPAAPLGTGTAPAPPTVPGAAPEGFRGGLWRDAIDVADFVRHNHTPYEGDADFLAEPTGRTTALLGRVRELLREERARGGVLDVDTATPASLTAFAPGWIDRDLEIIVGLQTDAPLKRAIMPAGGWRVVENALRAHGYEPDERVKEIFTRYRTTHNDAVFDAYTPEIRACRSAGLITGLPDSYGRGRIIGDYRRVALYGTDRLIADKRADQHLLHGRRPTEEVIRDRAEIAEQIRALEDLRTMAATYGHDVSRPARNAREAVQWLYFGYLGAIKEQDGAAMSIGRLDAFLDIWIRRDIDRGLLTEAGAQELVDDLVIKLRLVRFLRTPEYDQLFSGDPTWVTWTMGGLGTDGRPLVSRTTFRVLHTLHNLGPAPEPNLTVLWTPELPLGFREYAARVAAESSALQFISDEWLRPRFGDDTAIACCVSPMVTGRQMQFFGARVNLAKAMLYAINGGRDEITGETVLDGFEPITGDVLDAEELTERYDAVLDRLARTYMHALNVIHAMHDRYNYERLEMALHDRDVQRAMACGIAGLAVAADSLSAVRHARVEVIRDERGLAVDYRVHGEYPAYGNLDERADAIARDLVSGFMRRLRRLPAYRRARPTQSVLTITSNVVYGRMTGATPDGRPAGVPFSPGANPMNGRDTRGALASALSVAGLPFPDAEDGISLTTTFAPISLGRVPEERATHLMGVLDGHVAAGGYHMNVNVLEEATLRDAMEHPEEYPDLTIRVSGYAVHFTRLTREQQLDVLARTFHGSV